MNNKGCVEKGKNMKIASAKQKGRKMVRKVRDMILKHFDHLDSEEIYTPAGSQGGEDLAFSPVLRKLFPFSVEIKCQEKLNVHAAYRQAKENSKGVTPIVIFSRNRADVFCMLRFDDFLNSIAKVV